MDVLHSIANWVDHNRWLAFALALWVAVCIGFAGCAPKTPSVLYPPKKVTVAQLDQEAILIQKDAEAKAAALEAARSDLQRQYDLRNQIIGIVGGVGQLAVSGTINPASGLAAGLQLLTLLGLGGAVLDNRRKDAVIAAKSETAAPAAGV